jgi:hypothetical protein
MVCILFTCGQKGDRLAKSEGIIAEIREIFVSSLYDTSPQYPMPKGEDSCYNRKFCFVPVSQVNNPSALCLG